ncbi:hypothetical protein ACIOHC_36310 [Streptomyces sp. NPDC088252]|uniref:hypothetical protein n=1 Tax=Streptomyces sp. NPDC088252 TaxID=3365845 RepID=UPI00380610EC
MQYTVALPDGFVNWFAGTGLAQGTDDSDPECKETRLAYKAGESQEVDGEYYLAVTGSATVMRLLREYANYCIIANTDDSVVSEVAGAEAVLKQIAELNI